MVLLKILLNLQAKRKKKRKRKLADYVLIRKFNIASDVIQVIVNSINDNLSVYKKDGRLVALHGEISPKEVTANGNLWKEFVEILDWQIIGDVVWIVLYLSNYLMKKKDEIFVDDSCTPQHEHVAVSIVEGLFDVAVQLVSSQILDGQIIGDGVWRILNLLNYLLIQRKKKAEQIVVVGYTPQHEQVAVSKLEVGESLTVSTDQHKSNRLQVAVTCLNFSGNYKAIEEVFQRKITDLGQRDISSSQRQDVGPSVKVCSDIILSNNELNKFYIIGRIIFYKGEKPWNSSFLKENLSQIWSSRRYWRLISLGIGFHIFPSSADGKFTEWSIGDVIFKPGLSSPQKYFLRLDLHKESAEVCRIGMLFQFGKEKREWNFGQYARVFYDLVHTIPTRLPIFRDNGEEKLHFASENHINFCTDCAMIGHSFSEFWSLKSKRELHKGSPNYHQKEMFNIGQFFGLDGYKFTVDFESIASVWLHGVNVGEEDTLVQRSEEQYDRVEELNMVPVEAYFQFVGWFKGGRFVGRILFQLSNQSFRTSEQEDLEDWDYNADDEEVDSQEVYIELEMESLKIVSSENSGLTHGRNGKESKKVLGVCSDLVYGRNQSPNKNLGDARIGRT